MRPVSATPELPTDTDDLTVDEVARRTGTTVRTIRWYQSEGLLPSPRRSGRVAVYDAEHVARLEAIRDLQAHGLTLTAIRRLLDRVPGHAASTALSFVKAAVAQAAESSYEVLPAEEAASRLGIEADSADTALIEQLGIARVRDDGQWEITAPAAFEASVELASAGVPLASRVEIGRLLQEHTQLMARAVVELFVDHLWRPSADHASDPAVWEALTGAVERLRPLAATTVASLFDVALAREAESAAERELGPPPA